MKLRSIFAASVAAFALSTGELCADENWSQFRGPNGWGHAETKDVPEKWSASSVAWSTDLKGRGQSSPVIHGGKMFLTGASEDGSDRYVFCLDTKTGKELWSKTIPSSKPDSAHKMNSRATPSCATDGEIVVAFFGPGGMHAFDYDGNPKWSLDLGDFPGSWGTAASPIIVGEVVVQNCDATGPSRLVAIGLKDGKIKWETAREDKPKGGWSTPIVIEYDGKKEIVLNGEFGVRAYDPATGKENWFCKGFTGRGAPMPAFSNGLLYVVNGKPGDTYCVKPGGSGDVTDTHMVWHAARKGGRDLPSPVVVGDFVFVSSMSGVASCYEAKTGKLLWADRIAEGVEFAAAPLVANGLVYIQAVQGGKTVVIRPGATMDVVAENELGAESDEIFRATLTPVQGHVFARSQSKVYCLK